MSTEKPNPGSKEAVAAGCICAVTDNEYGRGYMGMAGVFVMTQGCPVHTPADAVDDGLQPFLRHINATHYKRYILRPNEVEAYKPGPDGWLTCTLLAPTKRTPRWRYKAGWGWRPGRVPEGASEVERV